MQCSSYHRKGQTDRVFEMKLYLYTVNKARGR